MSDFVPVDIYTPMTPVEIEQHLKRLFNELARAQLDLRRKRDDELSAKQTYESGHRKLILDPACPKVSRKEGGVTVDERDAWVDTRVENEKFTLEVAAAERANAEDYLRVLRQQVDIVRSLGTSARQAYEISGRAS